MSAGEIVLVVMLLISVITPSMGLLLWAGFKDGEAARNDTH